MGFPMRRATLVTAILALTSAASGQNQCTCEVVNQAVVTQESGQCTIPGQGAVACVSAVLGTIPGSVNPSHGSCEKQVGETWICGPGTTACTYQPIRMVVTPTACAGTCFGQPCSEAKLDGASFNPAEYVCAGDPSVDIDVGPPPNLSTVCGTPDTDRYVKLFNTKGACIFAMRYRFGCHQCSAIAGDG